MADNKYEQTLVSKVWKIANVLAADGVGFTDYIIQLTYLLFLKMDYEMTELGYNSSIPDDCRWDKLKEYDEVVHIPMSSGLSGSCHAAMGFADEYDGKVAVVDNKRISIIMKQSVLEAKRMADAGKSANEIKEYLEKDALNASIYVAVNTLEYLKKSGRVTPAAAAIGSVLNIKPVLQIQGGKLDAYKKVRGMNQALKAMFEGIRTDMETRFAGKEILIRAAYSGDDEVKKCWEEAIKAEFADYEVEIDLLPISICCHTGEGAMGIGIMEKMAGL